MNDPSESHPRHPIRDPEALAESPQPWQWRPSPGAPIRHGARSGRVANLELPEQAEARAALADRVQAILVDLGGPAGLSTVATGLAERHAKLELVSEYLFDRLQRFGPLTGKGYTRAALTGWLAVVDRLHRSAVTLGLERRSKSVDLARAFAQGRDRG
jgi:hypothetical protein